MNKAQVVASVGDHLGPLVERQFDTICRTLLRHPSFVAEAGFCRVVTNEPHPFGNFAVLRARLDEGGCEGAIAPLIALETPSAVILPVDGTSRLVSVLAEHGYEFAEPMPAMGVQLDKLAWPAAPVGCTFEEIDMAADRDSWNEAFAIGYEIPARVAEMFGPDPKIASGPGHVTRYFAIRRDGRIVGTSMLFIEGGLAGIYCVATVPEERGKGLGAYATAEPLRIARDLGYRVGVLQSSAMGESVYRRLGFGQYGSLAVYARIPELEENR